MSLALTKISLRFGLEVSVAENDLGIIKRLCGPRSLKTIPVVPD